MVHTKVDTSLGFTDESRANAALSAVASIVRPNVVRKEDAAATDEDGRGDEDGELGAGDTQSGDVLEDVRDRQRILGTARLEVGYAAATPAASWAMPTVATSTITSVEERRMTISSLTAAKAIPA